MIRRRAGRRRRCLRAAVAAGLLTVAAPALQAGAVRATEPLTARSVTVSVMSVLPSTPPNTTAETPLTVVLTLTNNTSQALPTVTIDGVRGNPISSRSALDAAIAHVQAPDPNLAGDFRPVKPVTASLGPRGVTTLPFTALTSTSTGSDTGLCICQNLIYPLYFTVHATDSSGADVIVGSGQTFLPAFGLSRPMPVQVSWVLPITDGPHRLVGDDVFTGDDLASGVAGGRLDRVLQVVERVPKDLRLTLVVDPELIDELAVMAAGKYSVNVNGKRVPGTGTAVAGAWLARLRAVLARDPGIELAVTPLADPDVESLTRSGLTWTAGVSPTAQARITAALGGYPTTTSLAWPADESLSSDTLTALVQHNSTSVILNDATLPSAAGPDAVTNELGVVQTLSGPVSAVVTQRSIQRYVAPVLSLGGSGTAELPQLVSEVAVAAVADSTVSHFVTIVVPRTLDPSPDAAVRAITDTTSTYWSTSLNLADAVRAVTPSEHGQLVPPDGSQRSLSPLAIYTAKNVSNVVPDLDTMLSSSDAEVVLGALPTAVQRVESNYWRTNSSAGDEYALQLSRQVDAFTSGVRIVQPSTGTYTLASSNSPLPVTVENNLAVTVTVRVLVTSVNGAPGFTAADIGKQTIAPNTKVTLHIPTHVERTGRFRVQAVLLTPSGLTIGDPVLVSVHSTALGAIGVIITIVAAVVLILALLIRLVRRVRRRPAARVDGADVDPVAVR